MNKQAIFQDILAHLKQQVADYAAAAQTSRAEANDEENQAEDKYDTRGLEASYLAAGQSRQMAEAAAALQKFATMVLPRFSPGMPIDVGALVTLKTRREVNVYFLGPAAGGTEVVHDGVTVLVLTPQSPLGAQLMGRREGDTLKLKVGPFTDDYAIASVS
jgi:transcription elongation GreA/GreB family factor